MLLIPCAEGMLATQFRLPTGPHAHNYLKFLVPPPSRHARIACPNAQFLRIVLQTHALLAGSCMLLPLGLVLASGSCAQGEE